MHVSLYRTYFFLYFYYYNMRLLIREQRMYEYMMDRTTSLIAVEYN